MNNNKIPRNPQPVQGFSNPETWDPRISRNIFRHLEFKSRVRLLSLNRSWNSFVTDHFLKSKVPVWFYVVFRRNMVMGHEKPMLQMSETGPLFWEKEMFFVTCCNCHFSQHHLGKVMALWKLIGHRIQRLCMVDSSLSCAFIPDRLFHSAIKNFHRLEFIYLRELNLQYLNFRTVEQIALHTKLNRIIAHKCVGAEVLSDFEVLGGRLMVVEGTIANNTLSASLDTLDLASLFQQENRKAIFLSSRNASLRSTSTPSHTPLHLK